MYCRTMETGAPSRAAATFGGDSIRMCILGSWRRARLASPGSFIGQWCDVGVGRRQAFQFELRLNGRRGRRSSTLHLSGVGVSGIHAGEKVKHSLLDLRGRVAVVTGGGGTLRAPPMARQCARTPTRSWLSSATSMCW
jgi:hypothetical protein